MANRALHRLIQWLANCCTPDSAAGWSRKNAWLRLSGMRIGRHGVAIDYGFQCLPAMERNITIQDHAAIGVGARFWNYNEIRIGRFCMLAAEVTLCNGGHDKHSLLPFSGPLILGHGCWIGNGARIIGPLTIGNNAIVAAGAVVLRDVPEGGIVAGIPARIVGWRNPPEQVWHLGARYYDPRTFELVAANAETAS
jgi:acetyltransferase-like isoleucine patch superfamily enzyme